ncbi:gamma-glutamyl-phosphate reductase, partial [bacterium]
MSLKDDAIALGKNAKEAARRLAQLSSEEKNRALLRMAERIEGQKEILLKENKKDLELARKEKLSAALLDRISLDGSRIAGMA